MRNTHSDSKRAVTAIVLLAVCVLLALPVMDTSMQYQIEELLKYNNHDLFAFILIPLLLVGFGLQLWLNRWKKLRWAAWIPMSVAAAGIFLSELIWMGGGWDTLLSGIIWVFCFPLLLGSTSAVLLDFVRPQKRPVKLAAAGVILILFVATFAFWPRALNNKIEIDPESHMLYYEEEGAREWMRARDLQDLKNIVQWIEVIPCLSSPDWDDDRGILMRLNEEYILLAPHNETPYIYQYTGELDQFSGGKPKWNVYAYPAMYGELRTSANWVNPQ